MVTLLFCIDFFIDSSINILFPFFNQLRMIKIVHDENKVLNKKVIYFLLFILIKVMLVNQTKISLNIQLLVVFATKEIGFFFMKNLFLFDQSHGFLVSHHLED